MQTTENLIEAVLEESGLTLQQLAAICAVEPEWVTRHIDEGLLHPLPQQQSEWRFSTAHLVRVRRIVSIERNFEALPELAALVADMQEEIDDLRRRLRRAGLE
jgi:chaperone modulatory protein CbpM